MGAAGRATWALLALVTACAGQSGPLPRAELLDPESCADCHPDHYREWSGSMHAYAADDPVFIALNRRGQEETDGALGSFCLQCHAPMALREGASIDGLNLAELDPALRGVTCYFCHNAQAVSGTHNNPIELANDDVMRGGLDLPAPTSAHGNDYSELLDSDRLESSAMCGSCHDVVTPAGVFLERTYAEYQASVFADPVGPVATTCSSCHMFTELAEVAAVPGVGSRRRHQHGFPGIDTALTDWPQRVEQRRLVERDLAASIVARLCVHPSAGGVEIEYILDNVNAGHAFPSGATHNRRVWANVTAYSGDSVRLDSGTVPDGTSVSQASSTDENLWQLRDFAFDQDGDEVHFAWQARDIESRTLPAAVTSDPADPRYYHAVSRTYTVLGTPPTRVSARVFVRAVGLDVIGELVASGHLASEIAGELLTFEVIGASIEWSESDGYGCVPD